MMAAFIIAVRGPVWQAVLLTIAATISHATIVGAVAILDLIYGPSWSAEDTEPYFLLASGAIIVFVAPWILLRTWCDQQAAKARLAYRERAQFNQNRVMTPATVLSI